MGDVSYLGNEFPGDISVVGNATINGNLILGGSSKVISASGDLEFSDAIQFDSGVYGIFSASGATGNYTFGNFAETAFFRFSGNGQNTTIASTSSFRVVNGNDVYLNVNIASGSITLDTITDGSFAMGGGLALFSGADVALSSGNVYKVNATQVVGAQQAAVADASGGATIDAEARTAINTLLARLRAHGLIAT